MIISSVQPMFQKVNFFGRNLREYGDMFSLRMDEWRGKRILDSNSGPASFVAEGTALGYEVVGCDPQYGDDFDALSVFGRQEFQAAYQFIAEKGHEKLDLRGGHRTDEYREMRNRVLATFVKDYPQGRRAGRYVTARLPVLPFPDNSFDLALSANLLFLYSAAQFGGSLPSSTLDFFFHFESVMELLRVAREVRVYPLHGSHVSRHEFLSPLLKELEIVGRHHEIVPVTYQDIAGAAQMLRVW